VGLDPELGRLPSPLPRTLGGAVDFCRAVIEATSDHAVAYKIGFDFFEVLGPEGWRALDQVRRAIPNAVPVIADAKRGDLGGKAVLDVLGFDATTANPYLGWDTITGLAAYEGKGIFVLCRTSNPGSSAMQELRVEGEPLYLWVARHALGVEGRADVGTVVAATELDAARAVRRLSQDTLILLPGVGAQGGQVHEALAAGANRSGDNALVAVSRSILYASPGPDFQDAARQAAEAFAGQS
jgi:orotidine-5'-phosphate decarboxylase